MKQQQGTYQELAIEALDRIAQHEKECGERWAEAVVELRELRKTTDAHAARWEKLAWLVVASAVTAAVTIVTTVIV
jgi:Flp pilus assembly protein TadB